MEHARARGETAIGWLSGEGPLHLAPPALERNTYKDGDLIIVVRHLGDNICMTRCLGVVQCHTWRRRHGAHTPAKMATASLWCPINSPWIVVQLYGILG